QGNRTQLMQGSTTLITDFDTTTNKPNGYWFGAQKNDENHIEFVYDKNGNRTAKQLKTPKNELLLDITYAWNAQNRMTRYTLNGITQTNKYQFSGPRYEKKETSPEGTETTRYYPDDSLRLLSEKVTDAKGQKSYAYIYLGTQKLARISKNPATQKDEVSYFLNDALGTPAWITYEHTASPNAPVLVSQNLRDPWGNEMGSTLFNQTPVRDFTGKQQDTLSNLYDFGFRYYDSLLGTWIGKDLVPPDYTSPLSLNEYLYALNNPTTYVDLDGREAYKVIITAFIPYKTLPVPMIGLFHGDHRLPFQNGSSRIGQAIDIETNPKIAENPTVHYNVIVGKTIQYLDNGKTAEAVAKPIFEYAVSRTAANGGDNVHIDVTGHGANPLVPFSPAIDYNFSMDITPRGNGLPPVVNLTGAHDGFPAYEVYLQNPAGNLTPVYQFMPTGIFPERHLYPPMDIHINDSH
ncbi:MAG: RHS repeat-associated core domain-containing protein, partial [Candidatus Margulisiibacteriota bacterium]